MGWFGSVIDADARSRPDDDRLTMNGGAGSGSQPAQESLFEVVKMEEGNLPI
jgi:hypothetical protein